MNTDVTKRGVYFFSNSSTFSYAATCLADGLNQLGVPVFANIAYKEPLISEFAFENTADLAAREQALCMVVDLQNCYSYCNQVVKFEPMHARMFLLCMADEVSTFCADGVESLLAAHENRFWKLHGVRMPIGFGLSSVMIQQTADLNPDLPRVEQFLHSFRPSLNQSVRACLELALMPKLSAHIPVHRELTRQGGRWDMAYYDLLRTSRGCLAYGGTFVQDLSCNDFLMQNEQIRRFAGCVTRQMDTVVLRWDSWRFWESLVSGCVTLQLDFDLYGFELPVMPENWKHYIGIDLANMDTFLERMMDERARLPEIAWCGREWALTHYSPQAVAQRFLALL